MLNPISAAFKKAKELDIPIFLSIGYSTCHWCHVMEKESFEDPIVAKQMNSTFINIKVDREEMPEIDHLYMSVCQAMTGHGGWPLTIVMSPNKEPFFSGTYFPKNAKRGNPGLLQLIPSLKNAWIHKQDEIHDSIRNIEKSLGNGIKKPTKAEIKNKSLIRKSIVASKNINKGDLFDDKNITATRACLSFVLSLSII